MPFFELIMTSVCKPLAISLAVAAVFPSSYVFAEAAEFAPTVVVTAGRQVQAAKDVLADNVVITEDEIAKSGATGIVELLQKQRGIEISRNGGPGTNSSVFIRGGSNAQNVVYVDGVRIGSATTGGASWSVIPLSQIERVEIVYGPLSSLYGADAMGGVIQVFTKKGDKTIAPTVSAGIGSDGLYQLQAGVTGMTGDLRLALNVAHEEAEGFSATKPGAGPYSYNADKDGYKQDSASGRLAWELSKGTELGLNFLHSRLRSQFDAGPSQDDYSVQKLASLALYGKAKLADNWYSRLQVSHAADTGFTDASYGKSQIDTLQNTLNWQNDIRIGTDVLQLVAEHRKEDVETTTTGINGDRTTTSIAASYVLKRDAHLASASARSDDSSQYGKHTTGSIAYGYHVSDVLRLNASYGTSFRAPNFNELYYPGYGIATNKPEQAKNAEAGVYFDDGISALSAVYYQNKARDLLVSTNVCPVEKASHPYGCAYNVNRATMSGLTLGASTHLAALTLRGSLDLQNPRDETTGKQLARRARRHGSLSAEYNLGTTKLGVETVFSGQRYDDVANKRLLPGYGLLNLYASFDIATNLSAIVRWNNALNKDYELAKNYATAGSKVFAGVNYGFK